MIISVGSHRIQQRRKQDIILTRDKYFVDKILLVTNLVYNHIYDLTNVLNILVKLENNLNNLFYYSNDYNH